jgi:signal transduction histidine kinase/GAF domain-containing protein
MNQNSNSRKLDDILGDLIILTVNQNNRNSALQRLTELCREAFHSEACTLVETDLEHRFLKQISCAGFDQEFKQFMSERKVKIGSLETGGTLDFNLISLSKTIEKYDLGQNGGGVANPEVARHYGLKSVLCQPLKSHSQIVQFLNVFSTSNLSFTEQDKQLLQIFAYQAKIILEKFEAARNLEILEKINNATLDMVKAYSVEKIYQILLRTSLEITNGKYGLIRQLNYSEGTLEVVAVRGIKQKPPSLNYDDGKGIVWKALKEERYQLADDVKSDEWKKYYFEAVPDTQSELAVPLLVEQVNVREGKKIKLQSRPLGVLNLESPEIGAFSQNDITALRPLVRQASLIVDSKEAEKKLKGLMEIDKKLVNKRNLNEVLALLAEGIKDTLNFEWVNISLISQAGNFIKSHHVLGLTGEDAKEFKEMSVYSLRDKHIQSHIVKFGEIEVISGSDARFDSKIYERFGHNNLIRVFVPILAPSTGEVIGTVEAGHRKDYRDFIDERDISFLRAIIANAAEVIDPQERTLLARIRHELSSSIVGIRSNANFLQLLRHDLREDIIENKLKDILTDCDILLLNVEEIEYLLGQSIQEGKIEEVFVVRDIIFKTVHQLQPLVKERNFSTQNIRYSIDDARRIKIFVEKAKLNQVVNNLLTNAIKYAKSNRHDFKVEIDIGETQKEFIIKFSDWGIGIKKEYKEDIFKLGFRAPEAIHLDINGSGLGLVIARERIREIGGELVLINNSNPTTFHLIIPKKLTEKPK